MPIVRNSEMSNKCLIETSSIFTASLLCLKMAVYEVFSHPELRRYKTHVCTKATLITFIVLFLVVIPPLFVVYRSYGELKFGVILYFFFYLFVECMFMHALIMLMWWIYFKFAGANQYIFKISLSVCTINSLAQPMACVRHQGSKLTFLATRKLLRVVLIWTRKLLCPTRN